MNYVTNLVVTASLFLIVILIGSSGASQFMPRLLSSDAKETFSRKQRVLPRVSLSDRAL